MNCQLFYLLLTLSRNNLFRHSKHLLSAEILTKLEEAVALSVHVPLYRVGSHNFDLIAAVSQVKIAVFLGLFVLLGELIICRNELVCLCFQNIRSSIFVFTYVHRYVQF